MFESKKVRREWNAKEEEWYFSVVDVVGALTDQPDRRSASNYWRKLKQRLNEENNEVVTNCHQLKLLAEDGKKYATDVAETKQIFRIIQSIPSKKAEPFKMWLAQVGKERLDEIADPEKAIDRAMDTYLKKGYSEDWIAQRIQSIRVRNELTDEWKERGVANRQYAILTDEISKAWSGKTVRKYKELKGLHKENLRDNMSTLELVLNMLAEATTTELSKETKPQTFSHSKKIAKQGGTIAGNARKEIENATGNPVVTPKNAIDFMEEKQLEEAN